MHMFIEMSGTLLACNSTDATFSWGFMLQNLEWFEIY